MEWRVQAALTAGGVKAGDVSLHVGRHYSIRDLITWCKRMQVITVKLSLCLGSMFSASNWLYTDVVVSMPSAKMHTVLWKHWEFVLPCLPILTTTSCLTC